MELDQKTRAAILRFQQNEISEYHIYSRLAERLPDEKNRKILLRIAAEERKHYQQLERYSGVPVRPNRLQVFYYTWLSRIFGFTFGIKLMERGEENAESAYKELAKVIPEAAEIAREEDEHEAELVQLLDEERLRYMGSIVLGLNDALVELTGALAGFTLALQNTRLIAMIGLITGLAAALSMAASEYLSTKAEPEAGKNPLRASVYTGLAYVSTVIALILPYLLLDNFYVCLAVTLGIALVIIAFFTYYLSVARDLPFRARFLEMAGLSFSVALLTFFIGYGLRAIWGIDI